ncbi:MAG: hypothetical protein RMX96_18705 [Nostoc sp. ChiSLP02]|nr:hypothetical protein [Nostoc sp. DedSLP05]MDZ8099804.1 hypothetical protein [Nostoc sp. DedSLP01]MDZ8186868.1 hypothetical protein [Nostoc sp. ChiSLP02]
MVISPVFAQPIDRPFNDQGGCTSGATSIGSGRKSCSGDIIWPDQPSERPNAPWAIIPESVKVEPLDERGTGSGCFPPRFEYEERKVFLPDIGQEITVGIPVRVIVSYNARGGSGIGERGRIECKVIGNYRSM